jgi:hypothetical protein
MKRKDDLRWCPRCERWMTARVGRLCDGCLNIFPSEAEPWKDDRAEYFRELDQLVEKRTDYAECPICQKLVKVNWDYNQPPYCQKPYYAWHQSRGVDCPSFGHLVEVEIAQKVRR